MSTINFTEINKPLVMGILNVTPDSFSDGGRFDQIDNALQQAEKMIADGADIIDIGGESTRPGAPPVSLEDELKRVLPAIEAIKREFNFPISLDTSKSEVMTAGIERGVDLINDVCALSLDGAMEAVAASNVPVCLMHMQGTPRTMQHNPQYDDLIKDILDFFVEKIKLCDQFGIEKNRILIDPGFGFGKTLADNYALLNGLDAFLALELPVLAGLSRKSMLGNLLELPVEQRTNASVAAATLAMTKGAKILRVHDVKETKQAVEIFAAMQYGVING
jgi:dihydropteroate synthase